MLAIAAAGRTGIYGDRDLLIELAANLIDNAIKFTPPGGRIELCLRREASRVVMRVADTGPGIAPGERAAVLRRFHRSDKSRHVEGSGLGLSLVSAIARLHDATLTITDARPDREPPGCAIELSFPATAAPAA